MTRTTGSDPEQLLTLARAGSVADLGELLEGYRSYLTLLARLQIGRRLQGKVDAADLVQETFLRAHRSFACFQGDREAELLGWLRQILASTLGDVLRRYCAARRRNVRLERQLADELDQSSHALDRGFASPQSTPSQQAVRREQAVLLANALEELPPDYREVIILHQLEDLSLPEVAERMDRSLDSVKNLWIRALARLRRSLGVVS
jgi:RNA polymerase sigma-70 factor (ECF subfamily)